MMQQQTGELLKGRSGGITLGVIFKIGLLTAGLALAVGCGSTSSSDPTQAPGESAPNVITSEPPENTIFPTFTSTPFMLPSATHFPTPSRTPFPTLTPTMFNTTPTPIATATPIPAGQAAPTMTVASIGSGQSQVHLDITVASGTTVTTTLSGPGVVSTALQTGIAGSSGQVRLTWAVNTAGSYVASGTAGTSSIIGNASVQ